VCYEFLEIPLEKQNFQFLHFQFSFSQLVRHTGQFQYQYTTDCILHVVQDLYNTSIRRLHLQLVLKDTVSTLHLSP